MWGWIHSDIFCGDRYIWVTLSLNGSTSMFSLSSRFVSDQDGSEVMAWLCGLYSRTICCCVWLDSSYRNWLLSDVDRVWVVVNVLTIGGGVFLRLWVVDWVSFRVLDACLVNGEDVYIFFLFRMTLHSIYMQIQNSTSLDMSIYTIVKYR